MRQHSPSPRASEGFPDGEGANSLFSPTVDLRRRGLPTDWAESVPRAAREERSASVPSRPPMPNNQLNRRLRTRKYGDVGGEEPRGSPYPDPRHSPSRDGRHSTPYARAASGGLRPLTALGARKTSFAIGRRRGAPPLWDQVLSRPRQRAFSAVQAPAVQGEGRSGAADPALAGLRQEVAPPGLTP